MANAERVERVRAVLSHLPSLLPEVVALYDDLHGHEEPWTVVARRLRQVGYSVTAGIGGVGVVGVLVNGDGPVVALCDRMQPPPIVPGAGHASNRDIDIACVVGAASLLADYRRRWHGALVVLCETALPEDDRFMRFPRPAIVLGQLLLPMDPDLVSDHGAPDRWATFEVGVTALAARAIGFLAPPGRSQVQAAARHS
jgi:hippurate hydrolase